MTNANLECLSEMFLREAKVLLEAGCWHGARYLAGYCLECKLKAAIARQTVAGQFPDKKRTEQSVTHEFGKLLNEAGVRNRLNNSSCIPNHFKTTGGLCPRGNPDRDTRTSWVKRKHGITSTRWKTPNMEF